MEIEIKLTASREAAALVFADLAPYMGPERYIRMHTVYFDDGARTLRRDRVTLRLRQEGSRSVCTLKTGDAGRNGLAARTELEAEAPDIAAGVAALLLRPDLPEDLRERLAEGEFHPTCGARFTRREALVQVGELQFLLSFDEGELYAGQKTAPLGEVELELTAGSPEGLVEQARRLSKLYGLQLCMDSKQKRASALED